MGGQGLSFCIAWRFGVPLGFYVVRGEFVLRLKRSQYVVISTYQRQHTLQIKSRLLTLLRTFTGTNM